MTKTTTPPPRPTVGVLPIENGAATPTGTLAELQQAREEVQMLRAYQVMSRRMGFFEARDQAVAILLRKAQASEGDDLLPIEEAIREQLIFASREIRALQPKDHKA
jgi:hypothetical protein